MDGLKVSDAAQRTGWSARMLRYLERLGLVVPPRTSSGYRAYGLRELNQLRLLAELRQRHDLDISDELIPSVVDAGEDPPVEGLADEINEDEVAAEA